MQVKQGNCMTMAKISAVAEQAASTLQEEAQGIKLATVILNTTIISNKLELQEAAILTDNLMLAKAASARRPSQPGHWNIRSLLAEFCEATTPKQFQVFLVPRTQNIVAHNSAKLAVSQGIVANSTCSFTSNSSYLA